MHIHNQDTGRSPQTIILEHLVLMTNPFLYRGPRKGYGPIPEAPFLRRLVLTMKLSSTKAQNLDTGRSLQALILDTGRPPEYLHPRAFDRLIPSNPFPGAFGAYDLPFHLQQPKTRTQADILKPFSWSIQTGTQVIVGAPVTTFKRFETQGQRYGDGLWEANLVIPLAIN